MANILSMSGWTQPHDALHVLAPEAEHLDYSRFADADSVFSHLSIKRYDGVIAWSLGAQLAVRAIKANVINPKWMVMLAPPMQFVSCEAFAGGMDPVTYQLFRDGYVADAQRTAKRFHGLLVKGDKRYKDIMPHLSHHAEVHNVPHWLPWLDDLAAQQILVFDGVELPPTLLVQGEEDAIVPPSQAHAWKEKFPEIQLQLVSEMGHTPHLHDAKQVRAWIDAHKEQHG